MTFATLVLIEFFKAFSFRSDRRSVLHRPFANRWLNLAIVWEVALVLLVLHVPVLQDAFGTMSLPLETWVLLVATAATVLPVLEAAKWWIQRSERSRSGGQATMR
jgi:Ca2+-transporting ATPase